MAGHRIERVSVVRKLLLTVSVILLIPVVVVLIDIALVVVLQGLGEVGVLTDVLRLEGVHAVERLGRAKRVLRVLLAGRKLVLEALLPEVGLILLVLITQTRCVLVEGRGKRLLRRIVSLLHRRSTERTALGKLGRYT